MIGVGVTVGVAVSEGGRNGAVAFERGEGVVSEGNVPASDVSAVGCGVITLPQAASTSSVVTREAQRMKENPRLRIIFIIYKRMTNGSTASLAIIPHLPPHASAAQTKWSIDYQEREQDIIESSARERKTKRPIHYPSSASWSQYR